MIFGGPITAPYVQLEQADNPFVPAEMYSRWIDWGHEDPLHAAYPRAMLPEGGYQKDKSGTKFAPRTVIWTGDWKLLPWEGDQELEIDGEIYLAEGADRLIEPQLGTYRFEITKVLPGWSEVERVSTGSGLDPTQSAQFAAMVAMVNEFYKLFGLDPTNPVQIADQGAGVLRVLVGALGAAIEQTITTDTDAGTVQIARL